MSWDSNLAATDAAVAGYFDTQVFTAFALTKPARDVNALPQADPGRPTFDFMGTIELDPELNAIGGGGSSDQPNSRSPAVRNLSRVCLTALATSWPWMLRQNDQIAHGADRYVVAMSPDRDGTDRVVIWLNKAKAPVV